MLERKVATLVSSKFNKVFNVQNREFFSFTLTFDNGDTGKYNTVAKYVTGSGDNREQTRFEIGKKHEYMIEEKSSSYGDYYKISPPQSPPGESPGRRKDPQRSKRIRKSVSLDCAIRYKLAFKNNELPLFQISDLYAKWINQQGDDEATSISSQAALKMATTTIEGLTDEQKVKYQNIEEVIELAIMYYKYVTT